jgi:hypothetical protein
MSRSYHNPLWSASRGTQRYDPATRRYKEWSIPHDWNGDRVDDLNNPFYPRFTQQEARRIARQIGRGRRVDPLSMGPGWTTDGPRV